jgi:hypothetical protein
MTTDIKQKLLIIHNDGALLYGWNKHELVELDSFDQTTEAIDRFESRLIENPRAPFIVVVDCIEEDFRHENVVHVSGFDRTALLKRKLSFLFRTSAYRFARIIGREADGRKDDKAMFSALGITDIVDSWLNPMLVQQIAIKSISSAAYVMETFAKQAGLDNHAHLLLVNVEPLTGVRQTYLQNGKVLFSRLLPRSQSQQTGIEQLVQDQAVQTRKYLERIKLLPYEQDINTVVFVPQDCQGLDSDDGLNHMTYQFRDTRVTAEMLTSLSPAIRSPGAVLLTLGQTLSKASLPNVYGPLNSRRYYLINTARLSLYAASFAIFISATLLTVPPLTDTYVKSGQAAMFEAQTMPLLMNYQELRQNFPETPIPSSTMDLVVSSHNTIAEQIVNPGELMVQVSQALSASPNIRLSSLEWRLESSMDDSAADDGSDPTEDAIHTAYLSAMLAKQTRLTAIVSGSVDANASVSTTYNQVLEFVDSLENIPNLMVTPVTMPLNLDSGATLSVQLNDDARPVVFQLALTTEAPVSEETPP